jgi:hypothetical protein
VCEVLLVSFMSLFLLPQQIKKNSKLKKFKKKFNLTQKRRALAKFQEIVARNDWN